MLQKNNKLLNYCIVILGALIFIPAMYLICTRGANGRLLGFCTGIGSSLFVVGIANIVYIRRCAARPDLAKRKNIEMNDERNKLIKYKTGSTLCCITLGFLWALLLAVFFVDAPSWIMYSIAVYCVVCSVLYFIIYNKYNKSM